jgi:hypothetical protein
MCRDVLKKEIEKFFSSAKQISRTYHEKQMRQLPEPTQRYLKYALKEKQQCISFVHLRHGGQFKLSKKWATIGGEEYFTVNPLGFAWFGKVGFISAKDTYYEGFGRMQVKLLSTIKLVDAKGEKFNQGELVRWLVKRPGSQLPCYLQKTCNGSP